MKFKRLRLSLKAIYSFIRGWYFRLASGKSAGVDNEVLVTIVEFKTDIRWREELGTVNENRLNNMQACCDKINGLCLKKGQVFSMMYLVGEPSTERGYQKGPVLVRGNLEYQVGGGLCQVSTTLFNAALLSNLKILEKHGHSWDVWGSDRFIDLGRDAVYVFGRKDIKFQNNLEQNLYIFMHVDVPGRKLCCRIAGHTPVNFSVCMENSIQKLKAYEPKPGMKQTDGWLVETRRYTSYLPEGRPRLTFYKRDRYQPVMRRMDA